LQHSHLNPLEIDMNVHARKILAPLLLTTLTLGLAACNTMRGVGEDTEELGEEIQEEVEEHD
jgi:predicted small secreted protein